MQFIVIFGPPAVGKMTVGRELERATGIRLFHNHMSIELVLNFFPFGSPPFKRLTTSIRQSLMREVAQSDLPGLCFTFVWDLDGQSDNDFIGSMCQVFDAQSADIALIELKADLDERLVRNQSTARLREKPSKRNAKESEASLLQLEAHHRMNSDGELPFNYPHIVIDNTNLPAKEVADKIIRDLSLTRLAS